MTPKNSLPGSRSSIVMRLSVWYLALTMLDIAIFWVGTGSSHMRLASEKILLRARTTSMEILTRIETSRVSLAKSPNPVAEFKKLSNLFRTNLDQEKSNTGSRFEHYMILSSLGNVVMTGPGPQSHEWDKSLIAAGIAQALHINSLRGDPFIAKPDVARGTITVFAPLTNTGVADLILVGSLRAPEIREEITSLLRLGGAMVAILLLMQGFMAYIIYRALVIPVKKVSLGAAAVGVGTYVQLPEVSKHNDEITQLIRGFNKMSQDLKNSSAKINFELSLARKIQGNILPRQENIDGIDMKVHYRPLAHVSGDFYDFQKLDDGSIAIFIADASGHGVPAALMTMMAKLFLADLLKKDPDPAALMSSMNTAMAEYFQEDGQYLTAFYLRLYPNNSGMYCNAMHPAPVLLRQNRKSELLDTTGFYVGLMKDPFRTYENQTIQLESGDRLILYTDGLNERKNPADEEYSEERLRESIVQLQETDPDEMITSILSEIDDFSNGRDRYDDETLIICSFHREGIRSYGETHHMVAKTEPVNTPVLPNKASRQQLLHEAETLLRRRDFSRALDLYIDHAAKFGKSREILLRIAACQLLLKKYADLEHTLQEYDSTDPNSPETSLFRASLARRLGNHAAARVFLLKSVSQSTTPPRYKKLLDQLQRAIVQ